MDWWRTAGILLLAVVVIAVTGAVLTPLAWPVGFAVWLAVCVGGSLFLLVRWHAKQTAYRCAACGHEFEISALTDFTSPHHLDKQYLRCPQCGKRSWTSILVRDD